MYATKGTESLADGIILNEGGKDYKVTGFAESFNAGQTLAAGLAVMATVVASMQ